MMILNDLRTNADELERYFERLPAGAAILERVREMLACEPPEPGVYAIADAIPATDAELIELTHEAIRRSESLVGPEEPRPLKVVRAPHVPKAIRADRPLVGAMSDGLFDLYIEAANELTPMERSALELLREPLYHLACEYTTREYQLTPLMPARIRDVDPFEPHFELWRRGAKALFCRGELGVGIRIYAPA